MAFLFIYCVIWVIMCGISAWCWDGYDPKDWAQTLAIVVCCAVWPVLIATWAYHQLYDRLFWNDRY